MDNFNAEIKDILIKSYEAKKNFIADDNNLTCVSEAVLAMINCCKRGNKIIVFGNGGSAADSQHLAAELQVRFERERKALPCMALTTDSSVLTAAANDYDFSSVFSRQIEAFAASGDLALAISTSGNSENVILAAQKAKENEMKVISLTGGNGGRLVEISDIAIVVKDDNTARIQEVHITLIHAICKIVEDAFCDESR